MLGKMIRFSIWGQICTDDKFRKKLYNNILF